MQRAMAITTGAVGLTGAVLLSTLFACSGGPSAPEPEPEPAPQAEPQPAPPPAADERPNVLIIVWDTVRADRMSLYGHHRKTTPQLDAWAAEATVYEQATAPGMWTLPTHATMFTGLRGTTHGAKASWRWLDHRFETLAETLSGSGYETVAMSSNLIASPMTNLTQGFETVLTTFPRDGARGGRLVGPAKAATQAKLIATDASTEISPAFAGNDGEKWGKAVHKDAAPVLHDTLGKFIDAKGGEGPWFAYLNMMEAHTPRIPSMSARKRLLSPELVERGLTTDASLFAENEYIIGQRDYTPEQLEAIAGVYDAAILDLDDATGALIADLRQRGILDDTLVILVADHGEALGEHRMFEHRWSVFEQLLHVPLVVRFPDRFEGRRVADRVSTADVYATVLDVTGVDPPQAPTESTSLAGRTSFEPFVFVQMLDPFASQLAGMREAYPELDLSPWMRTYCAVYEGSKKLIYASDGAHSLFDVHGDPAEANDLFASEVATAERLQEALKGWEDKLGTYDPSGRSARDGAKGQKGKGRKAKGAPAGVSAEECEQLKMLGYAEGDCSALEAASELSRDRCGPGAE